MSSYFLQPDGNIKSKEWNNCPLKTGPFSLTLNPSPSGSILRGADALSFLNTIITWALTVEAWVPELIPKTLDLILLDKPEHLASEVAWLALSGDSFDTLLFFVILANERALWETACSIQQRWCESWFSLLAVKTVGFFKQIMLGYIMSAQAIVRI